MPQFKRSYEEAVPQLPIEEMKALVRQGCALVGDGRVDRRSCAERVLIYFRNDVHPVMSAAGDRADCIAYLMGNVTIAEQMFRHDPRAMLYAPLHTVIWKDADGEAWFSLDQPSTQFSSFGIPAVTKVGFELDRKLAQLLDILDVEVTPALTHG